MTDKCFQIHNTASRTAFSQSGSTYPSMADAAVNAGQLLRSLSTALAAAKRAIGTRNGEQDT